LLNNFALLYRAQGRYADAESLYQRAIGIFAAISRQTSHQHPHLETVVGNYIKLLAITGKTGTEVESERQRLMRWQE
jgi:hypothetical protein